MPSLTPSSPPRPRGSRTRFAARALLGAVIGVLVLHPMAMLAVWLQSDDPVTPWQLAARGWASFRTGMLIMAATFATIGAVVGLAFALYDRADRDRERTVSGLTAELARDAQSLIAGGENERVELKSSARWDLRHDRASRALHRTIAKTIAAFMNHEGGSLLIGVADDGAILGLERDYATLKQPNRDGFTQFLMNLVKQRLGGDACALVHPVFVCLDGRDVCRVVVEPGHRPVYLRDGEISRFFVRTGNASRELDVQEAVEHIARGWPTGRAALAR